ncbi:hypothetical protein [Desulfosporosinus sp.]|uniref:hypothetical protein n=1 Tax=Desulfosporosinus sp. TaxID=157907 RepID=UPI002628EC80|nr:hypothetical protein [Desulfosporosinus sp.]
MLTLYVNVLSCLLCSYMLYRAYSKNNLIAVFYWSVFIFLVVGQAIHISIGLLDNDEVQYLFNIITRDGHFVSSVAVLLIVLMVIILEVFSSRTSHSEPFNRQMHISTLKSKYFGIYYFLNWVLFFLLTVLLIELAGGFNEWISAGRPGVFPGSTFFIVGLGSTMYPLLIKLASNLPTKLNDKLLFIMSTLVMLSFSRMLAVLHVFLLIVVYVYGTYRGEKVSLKRHRGAFIGAAFLIFIMMFGFGSYRHIAPQIGSTSPLDVFNYIVENPEASLFSIDLNYRISNESMSGLSGVLSESLDKNELKADFGLSALLGGLIQLIPSWLRNFLGDFPDYVRSFYHYQNSIVGGGLEGFFVHFSFFGLLIYPFIFFVFAYGIHQKIISLQRSRTNYNKKLLALAIVGVFGLILIRGSTMHLVFFTLSELIVMYLAIIFFKSFHSIKRTETKCLS